MEIFLVIFLSIVLFAIAFAIFLTCFCQKWWTKSKPTLPASIGSPHQDINAPSTSGFQNSNGVNSASFDSSASSRFGTPIAGGTGDKPPNYYEVVKSDYTGGTKPFPEVSSKLLMTYPPKSDDGH